MLTPEIRIGLARKTKDKKQDSQDIAPDYIAQAEAAANRIGKKVLVGTLITLTAFVVLSTAGSIAVTAFEASR